MMGEILHLILSEKSILKRLQLYRLFVYKRFDITNKIPILYKTIHKKELMEYLNKKSIEHENLKGEFGTLYLLIKNLDIIYDILSKIKHYIYFDFSYTLILNDIESNFNSCTLELTNSNKLYGEGVVIAFIDTGIDYTLDAFRNEDGTTRIKYMYDPNKNTVYSESDINRALMNDDPFSIVDYDDCKGHGTEVASIACAGGSISRNLYGVASKASIISINATTSIDSTETLFHTIMKGLDFLGEVQDAEGFPLVVNLSFSTNYGAHLGKSLLEEYVRNFATRDKTTVVVAAGNEGGAAHHKSGILTKKGENISVEISGNHKSIPISFYKGVLSDVSITITSPKAGTGIPVRLLEGNQVVNVGGNSVSILYTGPTIYNILGETQIIISSNRKEYIENGVWTISIRLTNDYESSYNMWLPITESIGNQTKFLQPDNDNTLGSPATVYNVISVGSYDYKTETVSLFSGRGAINNPDNLKPDLLAPGSSVKVIGPRNNKYTVSGTSFAAPVVAGICALLMEWGIVKGNKPNLYGEVIKYFLIRGATRNRNLKYPNNIYGYGFVCGSRAFTDIENNVNNIIIDINRGHRMNDNTTSLENVPINYSEDLGTSEDINTPEENNIPESSLSDNPEFVVNNNGEEDVNNLMQANLIQNKLIDIHKGVELLDYDYNKVKICPLSVFNDPNMVFFISQISKNTGTIDDPICVYPLGDQSDNMYTAILSIPIDYMDTILEEYSSAGSISFEKFYYYTLCAELVSPISDAGIYQTQNNQYLDLRGRDVIVGIMDTGIDYLNEEFMNEFDQTRILEIWDQTIESDVHQPNVLFGHIYYKEDIDAAIDLSRNGGDPYTIVKSKDINGHGTALAGITSAAGYGIVKGGAPESDIVMVKLKEISNPLREKLNFPSHGTPIYSQAAIYTALRYLYSLRFKYNKPMVVVMPFQSNGGDHGGDSILSRQISEYSMTPGFVVCVPSGNQANKQIHTNGIFSPGDREKIIEVYAGQGQIKLTVNIFIQKLGAVDISVISPSGEKTNFYNLMLANPDQYEFDFLFEETHMNVSSTIRGNGSEIVNYIEVVFDKLKVGIWRIILLSRDNYEFGYDAYLPIDDLLMPETRFLNSTSDSTVTSPGTSRLSVCMAYYNQNFSSIVNESGQGYTLDGRIAPILAAGGIDILTLGKGNTNVLMSGSSVAVAVAAGGIALILEWAIVRKHKIHITSALIIWLLVSAATVNDSYEYPNKYWGYGILNLRNVFEILR